MPPALHPCTVANTQRTPTNTYQRTLHHTAMNDFSDSGELFTIRNQFYTGQHHKVVSYSVDLFSTETQLKVWEYQARSTVALRQDASQLVEQGRARFPQSDALFDSLQAWNDLNTFGTDELTYFDDSQDPEFETQAVLTALYLVKFRKDVDQAIALLTRFVGKGSENPFQLEPFLILVQLYLHKENFSEAVRVYQKLQTFPSEARDDIIYQVLESWIMSIKGESDNISNAYYFYDELLSTDFEDDPQGKFRVLNVLLVMTLQLKHYPEAKELLDQIAALDYKGSNGQADLLANRVTYDYLTNDGANVVTLLRELAAVDAEHQLLVDFKEKNERFDAIVEKYQTA